MRGITAVGTVVLARILVPADFGVYAVLVLVQQVLMYFADFGVAPSLIQQPDDPTREELATLKDLGVPYGQGFLFSLPVPPYPPDPRVDF